MRIVGLLAREMSDAMAAVTMLVVFCLTGRLVACLEDKLATRESGGHFLCHGRGKIRPIQWFSIDKLGWHEELEQIMPFCLFFEVWVRITSKSH